MNFRHIKVGDFVTRNFCGMKTILQVTSVSDTLITAGMGWTFNRETGLEEDIDCPSISRCSHLIKEIKENE